MAQKYDVLKMYYEKDYILENGMVIHQPKIKEIMEYGENKFWSLCSLLCSNTTSMKLWLDELGKDWNTVSDYEMFLMYYQELDIDRTNILFGDIDFTEFKMIEIDEMPILIYMNNPEIQITEDIYEDMVGYLRMMFNIHPKVEKTKSKITKDLLLEEERTKERINKMKENENEYSSMLFPLISSAVNKAGFKYKKDEVGEMGFFEFMDSIKRLQIISNAEALNIGMYMGMVDVKQLTKDLNWTRDIY